MPIFFLFVYIPFFSICLAEDFWMKTSFTDQTFDVFCPNKDEVFIVSVSDWDTYISQDMGNTWNKFLDYQTHYINDTSEKFYITYYEDSLFVVDRNTEEWEFIYKATGIGVDEIYETKNNYFIRGYSRLMKSDLNWDNIYPVLTVNGGEEITCFAIDSTGTYYAGSTDFFNLDQPGGIYKSYDQGETWTYPALPNHFVRAMAVDSQGRIFVGTCGHYSDGTGLIFRSDDNGNTWQLVANGVYVFSMAINSEDEIFVGLDYDSGYPWILFSNDHGETWEYLNEGLSTGSINDIAISPDGYVYLATGGGSIASAGVYRSYKPTTAFQAQFVEVNNSVNNVNVFGLKGSLDIELKNIGVLLSENISLKASTKSKFITLNDSTEFYGNLAQGDSLKLLNCISYSVSTAISDQEVVRIDIEITDSSGQICNDYIDIVLDNPLVKFSHSINGSEAIYPSDTREITFRIMNSSSANINNILSGLIQTEGYSISISDPISVSVLPSASITDIVYTCGFSNLTPIPQDIGMRLNFSSTDGIDTFYDFMLRIGMTEDFETGDLSMNDWKFSGDAAWSIDDSISYEGKYSLRSGNIEQYQTTRAYLDLNFLEDGYVSFYKKVSCPSDDELVFVVDYRVAEWSGVIDWSYEIFPVSAGQHRIEWWYRRNSSYTGLGNNAWIDNILVTGIATGIETDPELLVPNQSFLYQNYPNPFNNETVISYTIKKPSLVELNVYNSKGELVLDLVKTLQGKGNYNISFNADGFSSGIYYYRLNLNGENIATKKMLYLR